jgi:spore germination cell wall hydrolase CwlJ-like protein
MPVTEKDRDILARTLWGEAREESLAGQIAVASTIRNRVDDGKTKSWWGEGYSGVCQKPCQFSCLEERAPDLTQRMLNELSPSPTPAIRD